MGDPNYEPMTSGKSDLLGPRLDGDANISIDVDALNCYRRIHGLPQSSSDTEDPLWMVGLTRAAQLLEDCGVSATFFVVGRDLEIIPHRRRARQLAEAGHEIANHSFDHPYDLRELPEPELAHQIEGTDRIIEECTGKRPVGFRTPGYNVNADVIAFSRRAGHRYDASVFPCISYWVAKAAVMQWRRVRGDASGSAPTEPWMLLAPGQPYFPHPIDYWRPASQPSNYVEIPMATAAFKAFPVIGTSLHLMGVRGIETIWPWMNRVFRPFFSLEMHAIDFVDVDDIADKPDAEELRRRQPDLQIPWETKKERYRCIFELLSAHRQPVTLAEATAEISRG